MSGDKKTPTTAIDNEAEDIQEHMPETKEPVSETDTDLVEDSSESDEEAVQDDDAAEDAAETDVATVDEQDQDAAPAEGLNDQVTPESDEAEVSEPVASPPPAAAQGAKYGGFVPMVLGGAVCLALGYAGAQFVKPSGWPFPGTNTDDLVQKIDALETELVAVKSAALESSSAQASQLDALRSAFEAQLENTDVSPELAALNDRISAFEDRVTAIEARPVAEAIVSPEATAAYERQLSQMQELLNSEIARLETAKEKSIAEETAARVATNKARLQALVDGGEPFADVLAEMDTEVPAALSQAAQDGIPSVSSLRADYAVAARAALISAAKAAHDAGEQGWFQTALRTQLGLRSTTPKEGDDADAILSRAEQSVRDGLFDKAIATLEALPEAGKKEMQGWIAQAQNRVEVMTALDEFLGQ